MMRVVGSSEILKRFHVGSRKIPRLAPGIMSDRFRILTGQRPPVHDYIWRIITNFERIY